MTRIAQKAKARGPQKKIAQTAGIIGRFFRGVNERIKDQDVFGQPIPLNYGGDDTFKTSPGGLLSVLMLIAMIGYFILKLKYMINQEEWSLIQ